MLKCLVVAHSAACHTLSNAFLKLLVLEVLLAQYPKVADLLCCAASWSEGCLFLSDDLFRLRLQSVQQDFQHNFARVTDEADGTIVLA